MSASNSYSWIFGPGEIVTMSYPPYSTPSSKASVWTSVYAVVHQAAALTATPDAQRALVEGWLEQLVWRELGDALAKAQRRTKSRLALKLSVPTAALIAQAMKIKVRLAAKAARPSRRKKR
jgi:hypothetical protein